MKKYFKIDNTEDFGVIQYKEFDGEYLSREVYHYDRIHPESQFRNADWDFSEDVKILNIQGWKLSFLEYSPSDEITKEEFDTVWEYAKQVQHEQTNKEKRQPVEGKISDQEQKRLKEEKKFWKNYWKSLPEIKYKKDQNLVIVGNELAPSIHFDQQTTEYSISGISNLDEPAVFYTYIINWLEDFFLDNPDKAMTLDVDIERFGEHDEKVFLDLLAMLPQNSCVNWYFEDEDQEDNATDISEMFDIPFCLNNKLTGEKYVINPSK